MAAIFSGPLGSVPRDEAAFPLPLTAIVSVDFFPSGCGAGFRHPDWRRLLLEALLEARGKFFRIVSADAARRARLLPHSLSTHMRGPDRFPSTRARRFALSGFARLTLGLALRGIWRASSADFAGLSTNPGVTRPSLQA